MEGRERDKDHVWKGKKRGRSGIKGGEWGIKKLYGGTKKIGQ